MAAQVDSRCASRSSAGSSNTGTRSTVTPGARGSGCWRETLMHNVTPSRASSSDAPAARALPKKSAGATRTNGGGVLAGARPGSMSVWLRRPQRPPARAMVGQLQLHRESGLAAWPRLLEWSCSGWLLRPNSCRARAFRDRSSLLRRPGHLCGAEGCAQIRPTYRALAASPLVLLGVARIGLGDRTLPGFLVELGSVLFEAAFGSLRALYELCEGPEPKAGRRDAVSRRKRVCGSGAPLRQRGCAGRVVPNLAALSSRDELDKRGMEGGVDSPHSSQELVPGPGSEATAEDLEEQEAPTFPQRDLVAALDMEDEEPEGPLREQDLKEAYTPLVQGTQDWQDGCTYRGEFGLHTRLGFGEFSWPTGETYRGHFFHDHRHGLGTYTWRDGSSFTGTFYLSRREGYGTLYLKTSLFQGLYKADQRFGPGVETYLDGSQDVGLWFREHLIKLCWQTPGSFSLLSYPQLAQFSTNTLTRPILSDEKVGWDLDEAQDPFFYEYKQLLLNDDLTLPPDIHFYSTDNSHLPMTPSFRKDLDTWLLVDDFLPCEEDEESWPVTNETPLMVRMQKHTFKFRHKKAYTDWNMAAIMQGDRSGFARRGLREQMAREMILKAEDGDYDWIHGVLRKNLASADVADAKGYTVLAAATVHCNMRVINLLLDNGADVNKSSDEGLTPLSMCFLLYYPVSSFKPNIAERNLLGTLLEPQEGLVRSFPVQPTTPAEAATELVTHQDSLTQPYELSGVQGSQNAGRQNLFQSSPGPLLSRTNVSESLQGLDDRMVNTEKHTGKSGATFKSNVCVRNLPFKLSHDFLKNNAHLCSLFQAPSLDTENLEKGTIQKMALSIIQRRKKWQTIQLLLRRGADPNLCRVPMQVLFFAVKAADVDGVKLLLENGARTDIRLPPQLRSLTPLHIAAALPGKEGVQIVELLLQAITDVDAQAGDQDEAYRPHKVDLTLPSSLKLSNEPGPPSSYYTQCPPAPEGGRTALHVACERQDNSKIVKELLIHGADPNLPLTKGLGNALCVVCDLVYDHHRSMDNKLALVDRLISSGADILRPVTIKQGDRVAVGTAVDYGYFRFLQDRKISHCPFHTLMPAEREIFLARKRFLEYLGSQLRRAVFHKEAQWDSELLYRSKKAELSPNPRMKRRNLGPSKSQDTEELEPIPFFKFCYQCGRSVGVHLSPCVRCYGILTCSKFCKIRAWNDFHKHECCVMLTVKQA
ncbi:ankyrin repeat and MYND domain-containing protein 1 [Rhynchocyon petersi]